MFNWKEKMKGFLVFVVIICMVLLLNVYAQNNEVPEVKAPKEVIEPELEPTRLNVKIIDEMNDSLIKLENCRVHIQGKLHIVDDLYNYTKTFKEGDRYEMTIHIRLKK